MSEKTIEELEAELKEILEEKIKLEKEKLQKLQEEKEAEEEKKKEEEAKKLKEQEKQELFEEFAKRFGITAQSKLGDNGGNENLSGNPELDRTIHSFSERVSRQTGKTFEYKPYEDVVKSLKERSF
jgi:regulator of replication initiation timing